MLKLNRLGRNRQSFIVWVDLSRSCTIGGSQAVNPFFNLHLPAVALLLSNLGDRSLKIWNRLQIWWRDRGLIVLQLGNPPIQRSSSRYWSWPLSSFWFFSPLEFSPCLATMPLPPKPMISLPLSEKDFRGTNSFVCYDLCSFLSELFLFSCRSGEGDSANERWVEIISWEPRASIYHNFLVSLSIYRFGNLF